LQGLPDSNLLGLKTWDLVNALGLALPLSLIINFAFPEAALMNQKSYLRLGLSLLPILFLALPRLAKSLLNDKLTIQRTRHANSHP
jgi:hypothetical protein